jgi:hypothetical protein
VAWLLETLLSNRKNRTAFYQAELQFKRHQIAHNKRLDTQISRQHRHAKRLVMQAQRKLLDGTDDADDDGDGGMLVKNSAIPPIDPGLLSQSVSAPSLLGGGVPGMGNTSMSASSFGLGMTDSNNGLLSQAGMMGGNNQNSHLLARAAISLSDGRPANISPLMPKPISKKAMRLYNSLQGSVQSTWRHLQHLEDFNFNEAQTQPLQMQAQQPGFDATTSLGLNSASVMEAQSVTAPTLLDLEPGLQQKAAVGMGGVGDAGSIESNQNQEPVGGQMYSGGPGESGGQGQRKAVEKGDASNFFYNSPFLLPSPPLLLSEILQTRDPLLHGAGGWVSG